ncbi:hypothetical protein [uncultured Kordia sp.]|uniref:hypothetical protein n=1 Tax=uncultured Kordia sp. TaxID=507699 RepID=UPI00261372D0|nr:hypothetical protein [uncultured Kordia sp.]
MKKMNLNTKLHFNKQKVAFLDLRNVKGGTDPANDPTATESLGKQSTCPIETCTCLADAPSPVKL